MGASGFVILVVFDILGPKLAPHLDQRTLTNIQLDKHQRRHIIFEVVVGIKLVGESFCREIFNLEHVVGITFVLQITTFIRSLR